MTIAIINRPKGLKILKTELSVTDQLTDGPTDGQTNRLIEMRGRIQKYVFFCRQNRWRKLRRKRSEKTEGERKWMETETFFFATLATNRRKRKRGRKKWIPPPSAGGTEFVDSRRGRRSRRRRRSKRPMLTKTPVWLLT